jgi:hypothetical protein
MMHRMRIAGKTTRNPHLCHNRPGFSAGAGTPVRLSR